ncbi:MAG: glycosyltransferase family 87 protein [Candidatus Margulisiibacteriota bacterium]
MNWFKTHAKTLIAGCLILAASAVLVGKAITAFSPEHQHDFISYYYGTQAIAQHLNPYTSKTLSFLSGQNLDDHLRFVYPPQMSWFFKPFTHLPFDTARKVYVIVKLLVLAGLALLWFRFFKPKNGSLLVFLLLLLFAFHETAACDLLSGNISVFEEALLWSGFALMVNGSLVWAGALIGLAACFKVTPLVFLGFLALVPNTSLHQKAKAIGSGLGVFALVQGLGYLCYPALFGLFLTTPAPLDSSGFVNPSSLALIQFELGPKLGHPMLLYALWLLVVASLGVWWLKHRNRFSLIQNISAGLLLYALAMPRFKDYTFLLLIIPAWVTISELKNPWVKWGLLVLLCVTLWPYHHLVMVGVLLGGLLFRERLSVAS